LFFRLKSGRRKKMSASDRQLPNLPLWEIPVYLKIGDGVSETIDSPDEALIYLETRWPAERGPSYERAKSACKLAADGYFSLVDAREAFVTAAIAASILD
jgi:hypothetical protein